MEKRWYVLHTYSGYENRVKTNLEKRVESMGMQDKIFRVVVPEEEEKEVKNGKEKIVKKRIFPGYVIVEMIMTDDSWYVVRNTPGVTGFVGSSGAGSRPTPLLEDEADRILKQMGMNTPADFDFELNEIVKVKEGPFAEQVGPIIEIDIDKKRLTVQVDMFGRETPVELDFTQIEKN